MLRSAIARGRHVRHVIVTGQRCDNIDWSGANFGKAQLQPALLTNLQGRWTTWREADLSQADWTGAIVTAVDDREIVYCDMVMPDGQINRQGG